MTIRCKFSPLGKPEVDPYAPGTVLYENVVEPLVSKEMWEECQHQKEKNQRTFPSGLTDMPNPLLL